MKKIKQFTDDIKKNDVVSVKEFFKQLEDLDTPIGLYRLYKDMLISVSAVSNHEALYKYALEISDTKEKDTKKIMRIAVMNKNEQLFSFSYDYFNGLYDHGLAKYEKAHNILCNDLISDAVTCANLKVIDFILPKLKKPLGEFINNLEFAHTHKNFDILDALLKDFYKVAIKRGSPELKKYAFNTKLNATLSNNTDKKKNFKL